ncbi:hypothetical protein GF420_15755 [candidate division GN15 bacterium]|nr:hypothetical protein [candidate division GN15 bacterium]
MKEKSMTLKKGERIYIHVNEETFVQVFGGDDGVSVDIIRDGESLGETWATWTELEENDSQQQEQNNA